MKKVIFASFMFLAIAGSALAQKNNGTDSSHKKGKMHAAKHHKTHSPKTQAPAKKS